MDKNERLDIIIKILTLSFSEPSFRERDLIAQKAACFTDMQEGRGKRQNKKAEYRRLQEQLVDIAISRCNGKRLDDLEQLFDMFYPDNDVAQLNVTRLGHVRGDLYYITRVFDISRSMVTLRDGRVAIRMWQNNSHDELFDSYCGLSKVEIWNTLIRTVTPDIFIAAYYVNADIEEISYLVNVPENISMSDTLIDQVIRNGIAETHMHANAGMNYLSVWEATTDFTQIDFSMAAGGRLPKSEFSRQFLVPFFCGILRFTLAEYLMHEKQEKGTSDICCEHYFGEWKSLQREVILLVSSTEPETEWIGKIEALYETYRMSGEQMFKKYYSEYMENEAEEDIPELDVLGKTIYHNYRSLCTSCELLFLFQALWWIKKHPSHHNFIMLFMEYLRLKNNFFLDKMQTAQVKGLRNFQRYFRSAAGVMRKNRYGGNSKKEAVFYSLFRDQGRCESLQKLEIKISPNYGYRTVSEGKVDLIKMNKIKAGIAEQLLDVFRAYMHYIDVVQNVVKGRNQICNYGFSTPSLGIVYHFIKEKNMDRLMGDICWVSEKTVEVLSSNYVETLRKRYMEFLDGLHELLRDVPYLGEYVVGIDAASDELGTDPWIFAPVYQYSRRKHSTYPLQIDSGRYLQNLGFTYHVGEDYRHLYSGLRHIDEVIEHFGYKAGDRLGHALALQTDVVRWICDNEVVVMPQMEYLENLLWLWELSSSLSNHDMCSIRNLEKLIMDLAKKIYDNIMGITPYVLWHAYTQKFRLLDMNKVAQMRSHYLNIKTAKNSGEVLDVICRETCQVDRRCFCRLYSESGSAQSYFDHVWDEDKLLLTHYCPVYIQHYNKPVFVRTDKGEAALLRAVQVEIRRKVQDKGIYVELNPTSNSIIGDMGGIFEANARDLNPPLVRAGEKTEDVDLMITVNSDDPLVFNTNVSNELAYIYHMLLHQGYSREKVLLWIEKIRKYGLDSSFIHSVKTSEDLRNDVPIIIRKLEEIANVEHQ